MLLLRDNQVNGPAAADVRPLTAAVAQHVIAVAAGVLQSVRPSYEVPWDGRDQAAKGSGKCPI